MERLNKYAGLLQLFAFIVLLAWLMTMCSCKKELAYQNEYPCKTFSRTYERFSWTVDSTGTVIHSEHQFDTIADVRLCGMPDISAAEAGVQIKAHRTTDSLTALTFVDSTIVRYR